MSDPKKYLPPRRVMPGVPLPTLNQRNLDERSFHLSKIGADTFSGELVDCEGGNIIGPLTLSSDFAHNTGKFGAFGATPVAQIGGSIDVLAGMVTLGFRAASSNPPLNLGTGAITCGNLTHKGTLLGVYNTTPAAQPAGSTDVLAGLVTVGLRAASSNPPLNLGTGAITAGKITFSGALNASGSDGTAGFVLTSNGAAVNPSWQAASGGGGGSLATLSDVTLAAVARGDVLYRGASVWQNLAHGTSGQVLTTSGAGADPSWTTPTTGNAVGTGAAGSEPGSPIAGDLYLSNNAPNLERYSGSAWVTWGPIYPFTKPVAANFTWINQGGASIVDNKNSLCLKAPQNGNANNCRIQELAAPVAPYTITAYIGAASWSGASEDRWGLVFRESSSGKLSTFQYAGTATGTELRVTYYTSPSTPISNGIAVAVPRPFEWMQVSDDATNRIYRVSHDGQNWVQFYSELRTTNLTADQVGWFANPVGAAGVNIDTNVVLYSWLQT